MTHDLLTARNFEKDSFTLMITETFFKEAYIKVQDAMIKYRMANKKKALCPLMIA